MNAQVSDSRNYTTRRPQLTPMPVHRRASSYTIPAEKPMTELPKKPRIAIGSDHAGFLVKETIRKYLETGGYAVDDQGTTSEESVDYPDYGKAVGERVASNQADFGVAVCGSGIGISIAANKVPGIRAALAHDVTTARLAREHNDANVLALGGRIVTPETALEMVQTFLTTAYIGGRHQRRLDKITQIERDSHVS
jgi:ribose 5-phosphate isomerase B